MADDDDMKGYSDGVRARKILDELLANGIKPNSEHIAEIHARGNVAVLVHKLAPIDKLGRDAARSVGWDGLLPVFELAASARNGVARGCEERADLVTARWLRGQRPGRIFAFCGYGSLLINHDPKNGYSLEPLSLDSDRAKA